MFLLTLSSLCLAAVLMKNTLNKPTVPSRKLFGEYRRDQLRAKWRKYWTHWFKPRLQIVILLSVC